MNTSVRIALTFAACALSIAVFADQSAVAQDAATFVFDGESLQAPATLAAGYHTVTIDNRGEAPFDLSVLRSLDDASEDDVLAALAVLDEAVAQGGDLVEASNGLLDVVEVLGGQEAVPGSRSSIGIDLPEGRYFAYGTDQTEPPEQGTEGDAPTAPAPFIASFEVVADGEGASPPEVDGTVQLVDFDFALPPIEAGPQTWHVVNRGEQLHHLILFELEEGKTMEDVESFMENPQGPPPGHEVGYVGILGPGQSNYLTLDVTAGTYVVICFLPDHAGEASGAPHFALGMMQSFTVADTNQ